MKYESPITYHSKDMANVKVFEKWVKLQGQGHEVKKCGTNRKVLS
jgi:NifU-like protein involved in Fe-S cluster formation